MQISRLFEITYLLMERGSVTAAELAERFEVSTRTIYRDLDLLSGAGIPVYTAKGKGGGIRLLPDFLLDKSLLSREEQNRLLAGLQGLNAIQVPDVEPVLQKLAAVFGRRQTSWLEVDFSGWGVSFEKERFQTLQQAILERRPIRFTYYSARGERLEREAEPVRLLFKGQSWYLHAFCRLRGDYRFFKLNRMREIELAGGHFTREPPAQSLPEQAYPGKRCHVKLRLSSKLAYRVYDEFAPETVERQPDGSFLAEIDFPEDDWLYGFLLSFGPEAELLEPPELREKVRRQVEALGRIYADEDER